MARKPNPTAAPVDVEVNTETVRQDLAATNQLATIVLTQQENAVALARDLGYEGTLTVGALEDEIRFYQRRSVEALLESGKRLLLLKEVVPHGEFEQRVVLLGFGYRTAARFMQAASKAAKSANLADLAGQIKNASAFLELITHDDDVIEEAAKLDDIDRMSASELRAKLRDLREEHTTSEKRRGDLAKENDNLRLKMEKKLVAQTDWPDAFKVLVDQAQFAHKTIKVQIGALDAIREEAMKAEPASEAEEPSLQRAREELANELLDIHRGCAQYLEALGGMFDKTLGAFAREGLWK